MIVDVQQTAMFIPDTSDCNVLRAAGRVEIIGPHPHISDLYEVRNLANGIRVRAAGYELRKG